MNRISFEEIKELFKRAIEDSDNMNEALENLCQYIYQKGYADGKDAIVR